MKSHPLEKFDMISLTQQESDNGRNSEWNGERRPFNH